MLQNPLGQDDTHGVQLGLSGGTLWIYNISPLGEMLIPLIWEPQSYGNIYLLFLLCGQVALNPSVHMQSHKNPKIEFYFAPHIGLQTDWINQGQEYRLIFKAGIFWRQPGRSLWGAYVANCIRFSCFLRYHQAHSASRDVLDVDKTATAPYCCNCVIARHLQGGFSLLVKEY